MLLHDPSTIPHCPSFGQPRRSGQQGHDQVCGWVSLIAIWLRVPVYQAWTFSPPTSASTRRVSSMWKDGSARLPLASSLALSTTSSFTPPKSLWSVRPSHVCHFSSRMPCVQRPRERRPAWPLPSKTPSWTTVSSIWELLQTKPSTVSRLASASCSTKSSTPKDSLKFTRQRLSAVNISSSSRTLGTISENSWTLIILSCRFSCVWGRSQRLQSQLFQDVRIFGTVSSTLQADGHRCWLWESLHDWIRYEPFFGQLFTTATD